MEQEDIEEGIERQMSYVFPLYVEAKNITWKETDGQYEFERILW